LAHHKQQPKTKNCSAILQQSKCNEQNKRINQAKHELHCLLIRIEDAYK